MADPETVIGPCRPPLCGKPPLLAMSFPGGFPETPARARLSISTSHVFAPRTPLTWPDGALCRRRWFRIGRRRLHRPSSGWMRRNGGSYDDEDIQRNERHGARGGERRSGTRGSDAAAGLPERLSVPFGASSRVAPLARAETRLHELLEAPASLCAALSRAAAFAGVRASQPVVGPMSGKPESKSAHYICFAEFVKSAILRLSSIEEGLFYAQLFVFCHVGAKMP